MTLVESMLGLHHSFAGCCLVRKQIKPSEDQQRRRPECPFRIKRWDSFFQNAQIWIDCWCLTGIWMVRNAHLLSGFWRNFAWGWKWLWLRPRRGSGAAFLPRHCGAAEVKEKGQYQRARRVIMSSLFIWHLGQKSTWIWYNVNLLQVGGQRRWGRGAWSRRKERNHLPGTHVEILWLDSVNSDVAGCPKSSDQLEMDKCRHLKGSSQGLISKCKMDE